MTDSPSLPRLDAHAARALAVLLEREKTVPDSYPMSLNSLLAGCNQRSNRDPVMSLNEIELLNALETLHSLSLVIESSGGRVTRYEHNLPRVLAIPSEAAALLSVLMLRGPQTAAGLRAHVERQAKFADTSSVEAYLQEMAERTAGAATVSQGSAGHDAPSQPPANPADAEALQILQLRVDDLERQVAALTERLERLES